MIYKLNAINIKNFRKFKNLNPIKVGNRITVFSGQNGLGKSSILSLIAATSGTTNSRTNGQNFQPDFDEYFSIDEDEPYKDYDFTLDYDYDDDSKKFSISKKESFNDYKKYGRGIRPIPRNVKMPSFSNQVESNKFIKSEINLGPAARIPLPTIFSSLSRIMPPTEANSTVTQLNSNNKLNNYGILDTYIKWFEEVIPLSFNRDSNLENVNKRSINKKRIFVQPNESTFKTQSIGQESLGNIISSLIDFYYLKQSNPQNYHGGILCIDEFDTTLHPDAQKRLFQLLEKLSSPNHLDLQIFLTSHSLVILEEILQAQKRNSNDYKLIYFKDIDNPHPTKINSSVALRADLFNLSKVPAPDVKIYCEDDIAAEFLTLLINAARENGIQFKLPPTYKIIPINLGNQDLMALPEKDSYFHKVVIILDGDSNIRDKSLKLEDYLKNKNIFDNYNKYSNVTFKSDNIMAFPSFLSPEAEAYRLIDEYINNYEDHIAFWRSLENNPDTELIDTHKVRSKYLVSNVNYKKDVHKKKKYVDFLQETKILSDYYIRNTDELTKWIKNLELIMNNTLKKVKSNNY